jgi:hypothetical protein
MMVCVSRNMQLYSLVLRTSPARKGTGASPLPGIRDTTALLIISYTVSPRIPRSCAWKAPDFYDDMSPSPSVQRPNLLERAHGIA